MPEHQRSEVQVKLVERQSRSTLTTIKEGKGVRPTNSLKKFEVMLQRRPKADALVTTLGMNDSRDITGR